MKGLKTKEKIMTVIKGDGNGNYIIPRIIVGINVIFTLAACIWAVSQTYTNETKLRPMEEKITVLQGRIKTIEETVKNVEYSMYSRDASLSEIKGKLDILINHTLKEKGNER